METTRQALIAHIPDLRRYARFLVRDAHHADDLVQDALLRALSSLAQFQEGSNLRAWLFTILRNVFFEQARRRKTERAALDRSFTPDEPGQPAAPGRLELSDLQRCLFRLPPLLRDALVLVGAHGLGYEEAAEISGVPLGTMKARVSRARAAVARMMADQPGSDPTVS